MFECQCSKSDILTLCFLDVQRVFLVSAKELFHCLPPLAFFFSSLCLFLLSCTDSKSLQGRGTTYLFIFVLSHCVRPKTLLFLRSNMLLFIMLLLHGFSGGWFEAPPSVPGRNHIQTISESLVSCFREGGFHSL